MFEKYYIQDPPRERFQSIEKSPEDYYRLRIEDKDEEPTTDSIKAIDEKSSSKITKKKPKKTTSKLHKAAMESIQA